MIDDLKPCPFCGCERIGVEWNAHNLYQIWCRDCGCLLSRKTIAQTEKAWNRRVKE